MFHFAKGATEVLLRMCKTVKVDGKREPLDEEDQGGGREESEQPTFKCRWTKTVKLSVNNQIQMHD